MLGKELLVYRNSEELRRYVSEEERLVTNFNFGGTQKLLNSDANIVIDISSMVSHVKTVSCDCISAEANLDSMEDETTVIVRENSADDAIELFPFYFERKRYLYDLKKEEIIIKDIQNKTIYTYESNEDLIKLRDYCMNQGGHIISFPMANSVLTVDFDPTNSAMDILIDLTSLAYAIADNKNILYLSEQLLALEKKVNYIVKVDKADKILEYYPLYFDKQESIKMLFPDVKLDETVSKEKKLVRVIDNDIDLDYVYGHINLNLFGHSNFKAELKKGLHNFVRLFKAGELPIYSIFLFGKSGIGKTEVARLLSEALGEDTYLAKINFQNYSSQDALNSLIGSPAGYIGCEHGELSEKISKSKVGVLLCDEFEKTTRPVFSFFLQLLEEGKFTDSLAREYDLKGYIVIFTSNLQTESEYKKVIPPELQTRFDLVCEFEEPSRADKESYLSYLLEKAKNKIEGADRLQEDSYRKLTNLSMYSSSSLRELKKEFNNKLLSFIDNSI